MDDLISRQDAIEAVQNRHMMLSKEKVLLINDLEKLPSADPKKIRGQWIDRGERGDWEWQADGRGKHWHEWECNICHHYFAERSFFCPHCGSDMRGDKYA